MLTRRTFVAAAMAAPALPVRAAPMLAVPAIDRLELAIVADGTAGNFGMPVMRPDLAILPTPRLADYRRAFSAEWGYGVVATAQAGTMTRRTMIDFGYTPQALANNLDLMRIDPATIDAMMLSHGHYDHFGGLAALIAGRRVRRGTPLIVGGEEAFCRRLRGIPPDGLDFGAFDRAATRAAGIDIMVAAAPQLAGLGVTTGRIPLMSPERPKVPTAMLPGQGCARDALDPAKAARDVVVDDAAHELGIAFHIAGRGLVVIGSCSHRGIINTVRQAQAVTGVDRIHAIAGGFHLVPPQTREQALETVALMTALRPDYVFPGHCTGETFIAAAMAAMPGRVFRAPVGTRIRFAAPV